MRAPNPDPHAAKSPTLRYLLTLPIRLVIACFLMGLALLFLAGIGQHYRAATLLKAHGQETQVFVTKRVRPRTTRERQYYILTSEGGAFQHFSNARYPVEKYVDVLFIADPKNPRGSKSSQILTASSLMVRGTQKDSLIELYFSSIKEDFDDYGVTHTVCAFVTGLLSVKVMMPPKQ